MDIHTYACSKTNRKNRTTSNQHDRILRKNRNTIWKLSQNRLPKRTHRKKSLRHNSKKIGLFPLKNQPFINLYAKP